ncbi:unnamed protein product [Lota lota]
MDKLGNQPARRAEAQRAAGLRRGSHGTFGKTNLISSSLCVLGGGMGLCIPICSGTASSEWKSLTVAVLHLHCFCTQ